MAGRLTPVIVRRLWIAGLLALGGCSSSSTAPKSPSLEGRWTFESSSEVGAWTRDKDIRVVTDGKRFRIEEIERENVSGRAPVEWRTTLVFDGAKLHETKVRSAAPEMGLPPEPHTSSRDISEREARDLQFWLSRQTGEGVPGGSLLGRETRLFQSQVDRPDLLDKVEEWVDAEHGVVLKSNASVYSKQTDSVFSKTAYECALIRYGEVSPSSFTP